MTKAMEMRIAAVELKLTDAEVLFHIPLILSSLVRAAAVYWDGDGIDKLDFCIQLFGVTAIVFGGTNRLVWTPTHGFNPDRPYCTERFLKRYDELGPLPRGVGR